MSLNIWRLPDFELLTGPETIIYGWDSPTVAWSKNSEFLAIPFRAILGEPDWCIRLWEMDMDFDDGIQSCGDSTAITDIEWGFNNLLLAVAYADGEIELRQYDFQQSTYDNPVFTTMRFDVHDHEIHDLSWHPDDSLIASADSSGLIALWIPETGETVTRFNSPGGVEVLDWNADGTLLASAGDDAIIRIWGVETGEVIATNDAHSSRIVALDWSPDDELIATASRDGTVRVWDVE